MIVTSRYFDIPVPVSPMRTFVASPVVEGRYPGIWCYSDIFQLTPTMLRFCVRLAGYGFVAAAPEIYHRIEPAGAAIPFDDTGRTRGMNDASKTSVADFDSDCRVGLDWLARQPNVASEEIGSMGFCIGGHLAFRAAFQPEVRATTCFYGTGIHNGKLGLDSDCGSLARVSEIRGQLLMVFGSNDPHVPAEGRDIVDHALQRSEVKYRISLYPTEHAFMRDAGPRFDPECTDMAFAEMIALFRAVFKN
jgi:carboxymethylenebutenolidase